MEENNIFCYDNNDSKCLVLDMATLLTKKNRHNYYAGSYLYGVKYNSYLFMYFLPSLIKMPLVDSVAFCPETV